MGWLAFFSWSISFYPQVILNFRRKSVSQARLLNVIGDTWKMIMSAFRLGKTVKKDGGQVAWKKMKDGEDGSRAQLDEMTNILLYIRDALKRGNSPSRDGNNGGRKGNGNGNGDESNGDGMMTNILLDIRDAVKRGNFPPRDGNNGGRKGNGNSNGDESNGNGNGMIDI